MLFSQATVQHWMLGAQGSSHETSSDFRVYQSIGQVTVTNTGTSKDFIQQGFQQSNWSSIIAQNADIFSAQIYPNPFTDVVSIKFTSSPGKTVVCEIYDLQGRLVFTRNVEVVGNFLKLDLRSLINSQFLIRVKGDSFIYSQMIIKK